MFPRLRLSHRILLLVGARGLASLLSAVWFLLASHRLGPGPTGDLALALSLSLVASIGAEFGTSAWLTAAVLQQPTGARTLALRILWVRITAALVGSVLLVGAYMVASTGRNPLVPVLFGVSVTSSPLYGVVHTVQRAHGHISLEAMTEVGSRALMVLAGLLLAGRLTLVVAAALYAIMDLGAGILHIQPLRRMRSAPEVAVPGLRWGDLAPRGAAAVLASMLQRVDIWIAALFLGSHQMGFFGASRRVGDGLVLPGMTVASIAMGSVAGEHPMGRPRSTQRFVFAACALTLVLAAPVAVFAEAVTGLLLGDAFSAAATPLRWLSIGALAAAAFQVLSATAIVVSPRRGLVGLVKATPVALLSYVAGSLTGTATGSAIGSVLGISLVTAVVAHHLSRDLVRAASARR